MEIAGGFGRRAPPTLGKSTGLIVSDAKSSSVVSLAAYFFSVIPKAPVRADGRYEDGVSDALSRENMLHPLTLAPCGCAG